MERNEKQTRSMKCDLKTRAEPEGPKIIEGHFAVFNKETELYPGIYEEIAPEAFNETMNEDIRALRNHDTSIVLGRTKADTLELRIDEIGLYGKIIVNENDTEANNLYERVKRKDVDQCSFGFFILEEEVEFREDGSAKWRIKKVELFEVSVCTFPAYEETGVQARCKEISEMKEKKLQLRKNKAKEILKNGIKTSDDNKKD